MEWGKSRIIKTYDFKTSTENANFGQKINAAKPLFFAPLPVSVWPISSLQFGFKNYENVWIDL